MAMASPFSLLEYAISVARDIWFRKVNVRCWLKAISRRYFNDSLDETEIDSADNLDDISSIGIDMSMQFDLNKVSEEDNKTLDDQQGEDDVHVTKKGFNLNKKYGLEMTYQILYHVKPIDS
ncbi:hypothetical protein AHAS_Ahas02G0060400 [Arachis hypogaea]